MTWTDAGLRLLVERSKTDADGQGAEIAIPRGRSAETCPVETLKAWLGLAGIATGPLFRKINCGEKLGASRLSPDAVRQMLMKRAVQAGLKGTPAESVSPHGLRAGFVTTAYRNGVPDEEIMGHTRYRSLTTSSGAPARMNATANPASSHTLGLGGGRTVSALLTEATNPFALLVLAHGAGAGMRHAFLGTVADGLARRGVSVLRYQFAYMEAGVKPPDSAALAHAVVRAAVTAAADLAGSLPLFAGGKSFGARMTSQAQAADPLPRVRGLVCFGFPLHPAGKPSVDRARHLSEARIPILFLQGTKDALADIGLLEGVVAELGPGATLRTTQGADHSLHIPARS